MVIVLVVAAAMAVTSNFSFRVVSAAVISNADARNDDPELDAAFHESTPYPLLYKYPVPEACGMVKV
jgi:hypothetical protein